MTATTYFAAIRSTGTVDTREIACGNDLSKAKRTASRALGQGQLDHEIVIFAARDGRSPQIVATRLVGARRWTDYPLQ